MYRNADTGYASWRSVLWARWPSAGPPPHFDSADEYDAVVQMLLDAGAMLRRRHGLLGRAAVGQLPDRSRCGSPTCRPRWPRRCCLATLIRAVVMTALDAERRDERHSTSGAARAAGRVLEVGARRPRRRGDRPDGKPCVGAAVDLLNRLVDHVRPALEAFGEHDMVRTELARIVEDGNGAMRQRRAWQRRHDVADVLAEAATATLE